MPSSVTPGLVFFQLLKNTQPQAAAWVTGNTLPPQLSGLVKFYDTPYGGVLIEYELFGLPDIQTSGSSDFYAMHIHENGDCSQSFTKTEEHYNPQHRLHPYHAGDLLPVLGNQGYAWGAFYDKRFSISGILGRSVVIHSHSDDFSSQPSGNSGNKIGCGIIRRV